MSRIIRLIDEILKWKENNEKKIQLGILREFEKWGCQFIWSNLTRMLVLYLCLIIAVLWTICYLLLLIHLIGTSILGCSNGCSCGVRYGNDLLNAGLKKNQFSNPTNEPMRWMEKEYIRKMSLFQKQRKTRKKEKLDVCVARWNLQRKTRSITCLLKMDYARCTRNTRTVLGDALLDSQQDEKRENIDTTMDALIHWWG